MLRQGWRKVSVEGQCFDRELRNRVIMHSLNSRIESHRACNFFSFQILTLQVSFEIKMTDIDKRSAKKNVTRNTQKYRMKQKIYRNSASHIFTISLQKLNGLNPMNNPQYLVNSWGQVVSKPQKNQQQLFISFGTRWIDEVGRIKFKFFIDL